jgi:putative hydrolase of the HAD superfamily
MINTKRATKSYNHMIIKTLFLDIGGILLNNGWGHESRNKAIDHFKLDAEVFNKRHLLTFETYEEGNLTIQEYLQRIVFYEKRSFSPDDFIGFMFRQSTANKDAILFFKEIKERYHLQVVALSNEGRELNAYRLKEFQLTTLFDTYISSSFVHRRKPDLVMFRMAMDIAQALPAQSLFIDDTLLFVEVMRSLGVNAVHYQGLEDTKRQLKEVGLRLE